MAIVAKPSITIENERAIKNREDDIHDFSEITAGGHGASFTSNQPLLTRDRDHFGITNQALEDVQEQHRNTIPEPRTLARGGGDDNGRRGSNAEDIVLGLGTILYPNGSCLSMIDISIADIIAVVGIIPANILENLEIWEVLKHVSMLPILVPTLTALLNNLHTSLVTWIRETDDSSNRQKLLLTFAATIVAAFVTSVALILFDFFTNENFSWTNAFVLVLSNVSIVPMACFVTVAVLWLMKWFHMDPNNLPTTLASTICDSISILLLLSTATLLFNISKHHWLISAAAIVCMVVLLAACAMIMIQEKSGSIFITTDWLPLLVTLAIYSAARLLLGKEGTKLNRFMDLHQIYSGINGYLISTKIFEKLYQSAEQREGGILAQNEIIRGSWKQCMKQVATISILLMLMSVTAHILVILVTNFYHTKLLAVGLLEASWVLFSALDLTMRVNLALFAIRQMFKWNIDRDNWKPRLTAVGDILCVIFVVASLLLLPHDGNL